MEYQKLINKLSSTYIIKNIFNFIKDNNLQFKLFIHSKSLQKKLDIKLIDYKEKYVSKLGFDKYLYIEEEKYKKNYLNEEYNKFLLENKFNKEELNNIIYEVLENKKENDIKGENIIEEGFKTFINIDSPLFKVISKTKNFDTNYTIFISQKILYEYNLKDYFKNYFEYLKKLNRKYSSIYYSFNDKKKLGYLKDFKIDFNKIKKMTLYQIKDSNEMRIDNKYFFETLFSFNNIENNLIYLNIQFNSFQNYKINSNLFENINKFKSLKYLYLNSFNFDKIITIKLNN